MITPLAKWLAEVDLRAKSKAVYITINLLQNRLWPVSLFLFFLFLLFFLLAYLHLSQAIEA
jgi:hypothetical protein